MKKTAFLLAVLLIVIAFAGCTADAKPPESPSASQPAGTDTQTPANPETPPAPTGTANEPNVWVVSKEAPVIDADTGKQAGTAYPGFMVSLPNTAGNKAQFSMKFLDEKGEEVKTVKNYFIDTSNMEKKYVEPQAVIEIISLDMIEVKPNGVFYNDKGEKLLSFSEKTGPFRFIQKGQNGYMMTIDFNLVFVKEADVNFIPLSKQ